MSNDQQLMTNHQQSQPRVTVLMSVYNGEKYLAEAVESILGQTFRDFEFLIVNDCSTDRSSAILESYEKLDKRIRVIHNDVNLGLTKSLNAGLKTSRGTYIARMDSDDISLPQRLERQIAFMDSNPNIGVSGSYAEAIGNCSKILTYPRTHTEIFYAFVDDRSMLCHPSVIIRASVLKNNNLQYNENFKYSQDYRLWNEAKYCTRLANIADVLIQYRVNDSNITTTSNPEQTKLRHLVRKMEFEKLLGRALNEEEFSFVECYSSAAEISVVSTLISDVERSCTSDKRIIKSFLFCIFKKWADSNLLLRGNWFAKFDLRVSGYFLKFLILKIRDKYSFLKG